jgi:hypothetical protein
MPPETGDWRRALPRDRATRLLLGLGAVALVAVLPLLWMWLLYASSLSGAPVYLGAVGLGGLALGIGLSMNRLLDGTR